MLSYAFIVPWISSEKLSGWKSGKGQTKIKAYKIDLPKSVGWQREEIAAGVRVEVKFAQCVPLVAYTCNINIKTIEKILQLKSEIE